MKPPATAIYSGRTRFDEGIVAEFWMPKRPSSRAIILLDGCPSMPSKAKVAEFLAKKGFWVFYPRYRGSWESDGEFLEESPEEDVRIVAEGLNAGFVNVYDDVEYILDIEDITVIAASFGGAAAILSLKYPLIDRAVAFAPVIDWKMKSIEEPLDRFVHVITEGFGGAYRPHKDAWKRIQSGKFYSVKQDAAMIDTSRLLVVHAKDDLVVPIEPLHAFTKRKKGWKPIILRKGGHLSSRLVMDRSIWPKVSDFLKR